MLILIHMLAGEQGVRIEELLSCLVHLPQTYAAGRRRRLDSFGFHNMRLQCNIFAAAIFLLEPRAINQLLDE